MAPCSMRLDGLRYCAWFAIQGAHAFWSPLEAAAAPPGAGAFQVSVLLRAELYQVGGDPMGAW